MGRVNISFSKSQAETVFGPGIDRVTKARAKEIKEACQEECPVKTGRLRREHKIQKISFRNYRILADTSYASHVFDGDGPEGKRKPNRWLIRGVDRVRASQGGANAG
jgi:hypothetical protein